ncbi:sensor histidine kinase [Paenibacillus apiarius]|uniref:Heme sensor protein HssS n=1 Tax=Paenibacillus apiarius TaxID=46240 RepID=A0ABT4DNK6_9BACL|nr:HAMP domain-containing sensor histidine kinase [Paenibacillus apiarius]MBN3523992.1 HAMP domain-containing histidine kinase [Paenibacillus apiarius]MCY9515515.1 HAMP domain-containing histidine kinase [Paenibacillus apiarius]MCY9518924.1 HAMP domain-containing histidine kinase [Paenibacillus apiarius]MCY9552030.1 HAMP domain-containing histidine kinase [Paenibacillus apiarius]MCY9557294.1 HAMP domain-containing histidine kinase [Paenibacillus apiarius]
MIKTLYVRVVLTFMLALIVGIFAAFSVSGMLFQKEMEEVAFQDLSKLGQDLVRLRTGMPLSQFQQYLLSMHSLDTYQMQLFDSRGRTLLERGINGRQMLHVEADRVKQVLTGEQVRIIADNDDSGPIIGLPIDIGGERQALFLQMSFGGSDVIGRFIIMVLIVVLAVGSLCFLVAARYIVLPVKKMTAATRRMAKGDFTTELRTKRKDEIGELAASFNYMAKELNQVEKMRQDFVSNVSHEIQSPLTSIFGFAKALKNNVVPEQQRERYLQIIMTESERLSRVSDNLLQLASLESEHHPVNMRAYSLDEQLRKVIVACEPQWQAKSLQMELRFEAVAIIADEDMLSLVWMNLIGNSMKFTPANGTITIALSRQSKGIEVVISDTGIGIPEDDQKRVFERFYKVDRSRRRDGNGSGLGLAIVNKVVSLHNGSIALASAKGQGTKVTVTLPIIKG